MRFYKRVAVDDNYGGMVKDGEAKRLAKKIADKKGAYEAILIDKDIVTEGTSSNVWIVNNKSLIVFGNFSGISKSSTISEPR